MIEEANPFVEEDEEGGGDQMCWRDSTRYCGSECTAYDERCHQDLRWSPCLILNIKRVQSKSQANIAIEMKRYNDQKDDDDKKLGETLKDFQSWRKRQESEAYAAKIREMDVPPPEVKI